MAVDLTRQFLPAKVAAADHAGQFGLPTIRCFTVGTRTEQHYSFLDIQPAPHIQQLTPKMVGRESVAGVEFELDDLRVSGISKAYPLDRLVGRGVFYVIGLPAGQMLGLALESFDEKKVVALGAIVADLVPGTQVDQQDQLSWSMTLRRRQ